MTEKECDRQFLKAALISQVYKCCDKPSYIAGVLISNRDKIKLLDIKLNEIISSHFSKRVERKMHNQNGYQIDFDNGSRFKIVLGFDGSRGHRYHDLVIDDELDEESKFCFGKAKILPYRKDQEDFLSDNLICPRIITVRIV